MSSLPKLTNFRRELDDAAASVTLRLSHLAKLARLAMTLLILTGLTQANAAPLNLFEWSAVSPIVAEGTVLGEEGRFTALKVTRVLRGGVEAESKVLIHTRQANRDRSRNADLDRLSFEEGRSYLVLLETYQGKKTGSQQIYKLVRGVKGARILPPEGSKPILEAMEQFIEIQDAKSENQTWRRFANMLEESNPILLENALDQFLKFRRGTPPLLLSVRPVLEHPLPELRERAAKLVGQVVEFQHGEDLPEEESLRAQLFARARRDPNVAVRVAACEAMSGFDDRGVEALLQEIAQTDPDQLVRLAAETLLVDRRDGTTPDPNGRR